MMQAQSMISLGPNNNQGGSRYYGHFTNKDRGPEK